jgi:hypothetical protein
MTTLSNIDNEWMAFLKSNDTLSFSNMKNTLYDEDTILDNENSTQNKTYDNSHENSIGIRSGKKISNTHDDEQVGLNIECTSLYISTKTMIGYLNIGDMHKSATQIQSYWRGYSTRRKLTSRTGATSSKSSQSQSTTSIQSVTEIPMIDLFDLFWKIPVLDYHEHKEGIIKKQIKMSTTSDLQVEHIKQKVEHTPQAKLIMLSKPSSNPDNQKQTYKVNVGLSKKDMTSYRKKEKNVFYNCFALIIRVLFEETFREIHIKLFNTGKMEIPGIQDEELLYKSVRIMTNIIYPFLHKQGCLASVRQEYLFQERSVSTVFINSNFNCGYLINRTKMFNLLREKYNILCLYDPCSYPGIQSKFYYNSKKKVQCGRCKCSNRCGKKTGDCTEISFMIFRTGSVLILGHCDFSTIEIIYDFLKSIFKKHYTLLNDGVITDQPKTKKSRVIRKEIIVSCNDECS